MSHQPHQAPVAERHKAASRPCSLYQAKQPLMTRKVFLISTGLTMLEYHVQCTLKVYEAGPLSLQLYPDSCVPCMPDPYPAPTIHVVRSTSTRHWQIANVHKNSSKCKTHGLHSGRISQQVSTYLVINSLSEGVQKLLVLRHHDVDASSQLG